MLGGFGGEDFGLTAVATRWDGTNGTKLDPFTIGVHVQKCMNKTLFPICKFFWNNQDVDLFMALVFDKIGMDGFCANDHYK